MNVLELLNKELHNKNWSIEQKTYYIYLRSCQLFSYDSRYKFCECVLNDRVMLHEIRNRKIDLENVSTIGLCVLHMLIKFIPHY